MSWWMKRLWCVFKYATYPLHFTSCCYITKRLLGRSWTLCNEHVWLFKRRRNVLLKIKRLNKPAESRSKHKHSRMLSPVYQKHFSQRLTRPIKRALGRKLLTETDSWASCQRSITATSFDTRLPPPDNTPWQLQTAFRFSIWAEIYHRRSDKLGEAATSLTGLTQSSRFSFTITAMGKRGSDNSFWSWGNVTLSCSRGIHPRASWGITSVSIWHKINVSISVHQLNSVMCVWLT